MVQCFTLVTSTDKRLRFSSVQAQNWPGDFFGCAEPGFKKKPINYYGISKLKFENYLKKKK